MADKDGEDKSQKTSTVKIPVAKKHKLLTDITAQLNGLEISEICEVNGHKYVMSTLTTDEEVWADSYCNLSSEVSAFSSMKAPRLAAAIKQIDGIAVEGLFEFSDDMPEEDKKFHNATPFRKRYWVMTQMLLMFSNMPAKFIQELWKFYSELVTRRDKGWDEIKNL